MKVLIVGYGGMGREIERTVLERGHSVAGRVDPVEAPGVEPRLTPELLKGADVVIEFAHAAGVLGNARAYAAAGVPAVVGTTGWEAQRAEVQQTVEAGSSGYLWGSNYSIGAHLFFDLIERAAALVNDLPTYDLMMMEIHHNRKKDSPSGTALTAANRVLAASTRKTRIVDTKLDRRVEPEELHLASLRGGAVPGVHTLFLDSMADTIEIKHTARNRSGFALGAVMAAEWLPGKRGFLEVNEFIGDLLHQRSSK